MYSVVVLLIFGFMINTNGLPTGAPPIICTSPDLAPKHGDHKPQPEDTQPFKVTASSSSYEPGDIIDVTIKGTDDRTFKGFIFQARDADTDDYVGEFIPTNESRQVVECSLATHKNPRVKSEVILKWQAPNKSGKVYFTGTVLEDYSTFWIRIVATV